MGQTDSPTRVMLVKSSMDETDDQSITLVTATVNSCYSCTKTFATLHPSSMYIYSSSVHITHDLFQSTFLSKSSLLFLYMIIESSFQSIQKEALINISNNLTSCFKVRLNEKYRHNQLKSSIVFITNSNLFNINNLGMSL